MPSNNWLGWFDDVSEGQKAYAAFRPRTGGSGYLDYWRRNPGRVREDYFGNLGSQVLAGGAPEGSYTDYLSNYPWMQNYMNLSPRERGVRDVAYAPPARFRGWL